ncbi:uncharacterized protein [Linepithema humile]|uniref:uncharacterized protein isoform X3 n=1 Tax=Linepithema humile TaxID=83485 RepID=UPI00351E00E0
MGTESLIASRERTICRVLMSFFAYMCCVERFAQHMYVHTRLGCVRVPSTMVLLVLARSARGSSLNYCLARLCCVCKRFNNIIYTILDEKSNHLLVTNQKSERFRKKNYDIGHWKIDFEDEYKYPIVELKMYSNDYSIAAIDVTSQYIISGSRNSSIKIRKYLHEGDVEREEEIIDTKIYDARTISIDPTGTLFIANIDKTFSTFDDIPNQNEIVFFDISKNVEIIRRNIDINYLDTKWQNPQSILMLDNNCIKKMDTRTSEFVQTWNNSMAGRVKSRYHVYNAYFTCFSSDDSYTIITGHSDGAIILWDQRQNNPVQMYENFTCVNAVQFDSSHMFVASDRGLHEVIFI